MSDVLKVVDVVMSGIVSEPDEMQIEITEEKDDHGEVKVIHVKPSDDDIGKCLGKNGVNASALRRIFGIIGYQLTGTRHYFKVNAPELPDNHFEV